MQSKDGSAPERQRVTAQRGVAYTCDDDPAEAADIARFAIGGVLRICPSTSDRIALYFNTCAMR